MEFLMLLLLIVLVLALVAVGVIICFFYASLWLLVVFGLLVWGIIQAAKKL